MGHCLRWQEILMLVKARIDRWLAGDLAVLHVWSEVVRGGRSLSKHILSSFGTSQRSHSISIAKLAAPSAEILQEMLSKHPQTAPPILPSGTVPPPSTQGASAVQRRVRSFPNGSAPGLSLPKPSPWCSVLPHLWSSELGSGFSH